MPTPNDIIRPSSSTVDSCQRNADNIDPAARQLDVCAQKLRDVVEQSLVFVESQFDRLEAAYETLLTATADEALQADRDGTELADERAAWEGHRDTEEARIQEQLDHLETAWKELEAEQRRLTTLGQTATPAAGASLEPAADAVSRGALDLVEPRMKSSSASAAIQFQKLRREILQQSRRPHE